MSLVDARPPSSLLATAAIKPKHVTDAEWEAALADAKRVKQLQGKQKVVWDGRGKLKR